MVDEEQVQCAEPLFRPSLLLDPGEAQDYDQDERAPPRTTTERRAKQREDHDQEEEGGLGAMAKAARDSAPLKMRNELNASVILTGGTSMFPGPLCVVFPLVGVRGRGTERAGRRDRNGGETGASIERQ